MTWQILKNKGTIEGTIEEKNFTRILNKKEAINYWNLLNISPYNHHAIHIISKKFGKINDSKIQPKADLFIAKGEIHSDYLESENYYLSENDYKKFRLKYVAKTGISVKRRDSTRFQIHKMVPNTFKKLFDGTILGAGSSIYCKRESELIKNSDVLSGWQTNWSEFGQYFSSLIHKEVSIGSDTQVFQEIKTLSNHLIQKKILDSESLKDFIFKGIGNFDEPYTATYLYEHGELKENYYIPFKITTGSGRSRGDYTIVLKPE